MPTKLPSRKERLARLKAVADGATPKRSQRDGGKFASTSPAQKPDALLLGVALRAASRTTKGQTLSPLEQSLVGFLNCMAEDDVEIADYGRIFDEAKQTGDISQGIPEAILKLPDDVGYTAEDCLKDGAALLKNCDAQPNIVVAHNPNGEEAPVNVTSSDDKPTSIATFFTVPDGESKGTAATLSPRSIRVRFNKFRCIEASGDGFFNTKDEIAWTYTSSTSRGTNRVSETREYGSVKTGTVSTFDANTILFEGEVTDRLCAHIQCFEMDDGPASWHDEVRQILGQVGSMLELNGNIIGLIPGLGSVADAVGLIAEICKFFATFWDDIINEHDFVAQLTLAWDRPFIDAQIKNWEYAPTNPVRFDGGGNGKHDLCFSFARM